MSMFTGDLPAASNRAGYSQLFAVADDDTGELLDLSAANIVFEIRDPNTLLPLLRATTADGKASVIDAGTFQVTFSLAEMQQLCPRIYDAGCTIQNGAADPIQFIAGTIAVFDGVVSQ